MAQYDYVMYVHPSLGLLCQEILRQIFQMLKMLGQKEYDDKIKELVDSICMIQI